MKNEFTGGYIRIRIILRRDAKLIHVELTTALGPNMRSYSTIYRWAKHFHGRREDTNDECQFCRPISEFTHVNIEIIRQVVNNNPRSTYNDITPETTLSYGTIE
jgi:hypothetical protein